MNDVQNPPLIEWISLSNCGKVICMTPNACHALKFHFMCLGTNIVFSSFGLQVLQRLAYSAFHKGFFALHIEMKFPYQLAHSRLRDLINL
jgi:hypothetical protein